MNLIQRNGYLIAAVCLSVFFTMMVVNKLERDASYEEITVLEGDTLWAYSEKYSGNMPTEQWIIEIMKLNELHSSNIKVGETIRIPVQHSNSYSNDIATHFTEDER